MDVEESSVELNSKAGLLAFSGGEARLLAGARVQKNSVQQGGAQVVAGAESLRAPGGRVCVSKHAQTGGKVAVEGGGTVTDIVARRSQPPQRLAT